MPKPYLTQFRRFTLNISKEEQDQWGKNNRATKQQRMQTRTSTRSKGTTGWRGADRWGSQPPCPNGAPKAQGHRRDGTAWGGSSPAGQEAAGAASPELTCRSSALPLSQGRVNVGIFMTCTLTQPHVLPHPLSA